MDIQKEQGFGLLRIIIILAIFVVVISFLGISFEQDIVQNEQVQNNFGFVIDWLTGIWENHLATPVLYVWNNIIIDLVWNPLVAMIVG